MTNLGYVDLGLTRRHPSDIEQDLQAWHGYPVAGIFFDHVPTSLCDLATVARYVQRGHGMIVLNPGTRCHPGYAALADLICTFEGSWQDYRALPPGPEFGNAAHIVYAVPMPDLSLARELVAQRAAAGLVTELDTPLPCRENP